MSSVLEELAKSRADIIRRMVGANVSYTHYDRLIRDAKEQLDKIDALIVKLAECSPTTPAPPEVER